MDRAQWLKTAEKVDNSIWQPAETMPIYAAQYWFEIIDVRVMPMSEIDCPLAYCAGLTDTVFETYPPQPIPGVTFEQAYSNWNAAYPDYLWHGDRWVILLSIKRVENG